MSFPFTAVNTHKGSIPKFGRKMSNLGRPGVGLRSGPGSFYHAPHWPNPNPNEPEALSGVHLFLPRSADPEPVSGPPLRPSSLCHSSNSDQITIVDSISSWK
jgi:hypothetical protein